MATENIFENLSSGLTKDASVRNIYGEPVQANGKTIIPVASISYGFGGGFGQGKRKMKGRSDVQADAANNEPAGEGGGGGGGLVAVAKGVFEITPKSTRFVPAIPVRHFLAGVVAGILLKALLSSKHRK